MKPVAVITRGLTLAASLLLGACSMFGSSAVKQKPADLAAIKSTTEIVQRWQASIGKAGEFVFTPARVGDSVFIAAKNGSLARYDKGREAWRISVGQDLSGGVGADAKLVVVGTAKGQVLAFSAESGKPAWKAAASSEILAAPAVAEGMVVVRSGDARIFAFEAADGKRRWVYQRTTPSLSLRSHVGVVIAERLVLAGFPGGKMVALANGNGVTMWELTVAQPKGSTELERIADLSSPPVMAGREVCAVAYQGRVACFDAGNGTQLWSRDISSSTGLDMDAKALFVSDEKGAVQAFDRNTGASLWKQDKLFLRGVSRPLLLGNYVAVADYEGVVHLLSREDGSFAARFKTDGSAIVADPQRGEAPGDFIVQTKDGSVYGLGLR